MKTVSLSGSPRADVGKKDATALRNEGNVPCVIYGGKEQIHFFTSEKSFKNIIYTPEVSQIEIDIAGKKFKAILQETQFHKINDQLIHADFLELIPGKQVIMNIPVKTEGVSIGVKDGGKLNIKLRKLRIKGLPEHMPSSVLIDIEKLTIGKTVTVGDIDVKNCELINAKNVTVLAVETTRAVAAEVTTAAKPAAAAAAATPAPAAKK